jgi:RimJ/RimL family protein N-acetyltransferase
MLKHRNALASDVDLYYAWTNDSEVRKNSYQSAAIPYENHVDWFHSKLKSPNTLLLIFENELKEAVGQVRLETDGNTAVIGISIDKNHRGKGYALEMLKAGCREYFSFNPNNCILAYIKKDNFASYKAFVAAGYKLLEEVEEAGVPSYKLKKENVSLSE